LGAGLARYDIGVRQEEGADCSINGLYLAMDSQHVDNHLRIDHLKPYGTSNLLFKGVLGGRGRAVFNGKVVVHEGASKTNANQTNNNLLLSEEAEADPKPELEIYHNDVKCAHGATVGQLDEDALFYLRSRGIALPEARQILTVGFAKEVLQSIRIDRLEAYSECQLIQRLGGMRHE
jgi:Fe-S cluster assembly protein SufD